MAGSDKRKSATLVEFEERRMGNANTVRGLITAHVNLSPRRSFVAVVAVCAAVILLVDIRAASGAPVPDEPIAIGWAPQFFFDEYLVDNRFAVQAGKSEIPLHKFHTPVKHSRNPVLV